VLKRGCTADFLISIGLTLLGHVPGIAYAWYVIYNHRDDANINRHQGRAYIAVPQNQSRSQIQQQPVVAHNQPPPYQATTAGAPVPAVAPAPVK
ncbi:hypothetical protein BG011_001174, partial [Mortierella polycephala]